MGKRLDKIRQLGLGNLNRADLLARAQQAGLDGAHAIEPLRLAAMSNDQLMDYIVDHQAPEETGKD